MSFCWRGEQEDTDHCWPLRPWTWLLTPRVLQGLYESLPSKEVRAIFRKATEMLEAHASPTRAVPPPPAKLLEVVPRSPPLPTASSPPLPVYDITTEYNFDGTSYGKDYLSLQCGQKLKLLPFPEDGEGWWFGEVAITGHRGWFPPSFVSEWF